jgi:hypothetical protein
MSVLDSVTSRFSGGNFLGVIGNVIIIIAIAAAVVGIVWFVKNRKSYTTMVPIIADRSGSVRYFTDWACYSKDKKNSLWDFKLQKGKDTLMPPPDQTLLVGASGNNVAPFYQNSAGELYPCKLEISKPEHWEEIEVEQKMPDGKYQTIKTKVAKLQIKVIEPDIALWGTMRAEKNRQVYGNQNFWDKYGNHIMFFGTACLTLALIFMVLKRIDVVEEAARLFREAAEVLKASSVTTPSLAP